MEHHLHMLKFFCHLCGSSVPANKQKDPKKLRNIGWKNKTVKDVKDALLEHYNIDVDEDNKQVHPPKICSRCKEHISSLSKSVNVSLTKVFMFQEHIEVDCHVCTEYEDTCIEKLSDQDSGFGQEKNNKGLDHDECVETVLIKQCPKCKRCLLSSTAENHVLDCKEEEIKYDINLFVNGELATEFMCLICREVPLCPLPIITNCNPKGHLFCQSCISRLLSYDNRTCPYCKEPLETFEELLERSFPMVLAGILQEHLTLKCTFSESCYCEFTGTYRELQNHLRICEFKNGTINYQSECAKTNRSHKGIAGRPKMRPDEKIPLQDCKVSYVKTARHLTKITEATDEAIEHFSENKTDCKYFMLIEQLKNTKRTAEARAVDNIWRHGIQELTADECLALKVKRLMSDDQYVTEYKWLNEHNYPILKPLNQLKKIEHKYLPGFVEFQILSEDGQQLLETTNSQKLKIQSHFVNHLTSQKII